jgi:hypothetical protein
MDNILMAKKVAKNVVQLAKHVELQLNVLLAQKLDTQPMLKELAHLFVETELLLLDKAAIQEM